MARARSIHRGCNAFHQNRITDSSCGDTVRDNVTRVAACMLVASLAWTTVCAGQTGPGIALKIGAQTVEDPIDLDKTTRARLELEIASPVFCDDHLDVAFAIGGSSIGSLHDDYVTSDEFGLIEESYDDDFRMFDVRLAARLYPFGYDRRVRPYVGAGLGYFWFIDYWEYEYGETFEDPLFPGTFHTIVNKDEGSETMAHGLFPFVVAGLSLAVSDNADLMFEFQYDIDKEDAGIDLSGPIYMFGGRFRF
jgi:hypothetical protein